MSDEKSTETLNKRYADIFNALKVPGRIETLRGIYDGKTISQIRDDIDISSGGIDKYFKDLSKSGLVKRKERGNYEITPTGKLIVEKILDPESDISKIVSEQATDILMRDIKEQLEDVPEEKVKEIIEKLLEKYDKD